MCAAMSMTNLQDKTPGLENAVDDTAEGAEREISRVQHFFTEVYDYLISTEFLANVIASVGVSLIGLFVYRVRPHGGPRVLRWRRRRA